MGASSCWLLQGLFLLAANVSAPAVKATDVAGLKLGSVVSCFTELTLHVHLVIEQLRQADQVHTANSVGYLA